MRLRPFIISHDFEAIKSWMTDPRTHAMWCSELFRFPLERDDLAAVFEEMFEKYGDCPFAALSDDGKVVGTVCCSLDFAANEAMLAFVAIDPALRGKGVGKEMVLLAAEYCFDILGADSVQLNVFAENTAAVRCYEAAGFKVRRVTENAYTYKDESWSKLNMVLHKPQRT